ncbi:MAG: calcium/sodium antiporter [Firmicutes bacterium]|nr:calcium/sodium antiporter [Bacillota bacterium]
MLIDALLLIIGLLLLVKGADIFVTASVGIARKLEIPTTIIALTIVAMGTSAPEAVVSISASIRHSNALAIGSIVGTNFFNLMLIVGLCAIIKPISVHVKEIALDFWVSIFAAAALLAVMVLSPTGHISRFASLLFLLGFLLFMGYSIWHALKHRTEEQLHHGKERPMWLNILLVVVGFAAVLGGGELAVTGALDVAYTIGMTERVVGLTILAMGTSLPELVISISACRRGENDFAIVNVAGTNLFNILGILGVSGLVSPLSIDPALIQDAAVLFVSSLLTLAFVYFSKGLSRIQGAVMVAIFVVYTAYILIV